MVLDIEQVLELMENGFTREGACMAVSESHGENEWDNPYMIALLAEPEIQAFPERPWY